MPRKIVIGAAVVGAAIFAGGLIMADDYITQKEGPRHHPARPKKHSDKTGFWACVEKVFN